MNKEPIRKYRTVDNTFQILCYRKHEKCGENCPQRELWQRVANYQKLKFKCCAKNGENEWKTMFEYNDLDMMFS